MSLVWNILAVLAGGAAGAALSAMILISRNRQRLAQHQREAVAALEKERATARQEIVQIQTQTNQDAVTRRQELDQREKYLAERESLLNTQLNRVLQSEEQAKQQRELLDQKQAQLEQSQAGLRQLTEQRRQQLEKLSGVSSEAARAQFLKEVEQESLADAANISRHILEDAKAHAEEKARKIIITAVQRYAGNQAIECSSATIILQSSDIKGRIIGREGRNIRAFENATGVTVLIDDEAGAVTLSAFDPVRREIAREAMARLIQDGRIHPTRIEEVVQEVKSEMEDTIIRKGEEAAARAGVTLLNPELTKYLGKLFFRQSYAQNQLDHSVEVAQLAGLMAAELGLDAPTARRAGLLHDIGKALTHEVEGPHAIVGADLIQRYGESPVIVNCVASHHNDIAPIGPWGLLVSAADAISASRPGARSESLTTYLKRIEELEQIGLGFSGVEKCFALQAGRELRVFVQPQNISDEQAFSLARRIAGKIEAELQYPGQIRVTVIREVRCIEVAK